MLFTEEKVGIINLFTIYSESKYSDELEMTVKYGPRKVQKQLEIRGTCTKELYGEFEDEDGETDVELEDPNEMEDYYYNEDEILESQPSKEEIISEIEFHLSEITELLKILK
jgi:hypothetical protein